MGAPLISHEIGFDTRSFAFRDNPAQSLDQRLNLVERNRGERRAREDRGEGFALLRVHATTISESDIVRKTVMSSGPDFRRLTFELTGPLRWDGLARAGKIYRVPQAGPRRPAVVGPVVQRGVMPRVLAPPTWRKPGFRS